MQTYGDKPVHYQWLRHDRSGRGKERAAVRDTLRFEALPFTHYLLQDDTSKSEAWAWRELQQRLQVQQEVDAAWHEYAGTKAMRLFVEHVYAEMPWYILQRVQRQHDAGMRTCAGPGVCRFCPSGARLAITPPRCSDCHHPDLDECPADCWGAP